MLSFSWPAALIDYVRQDKFDKPNIARGRKTIGELHILTIENLLLQRHRVVVCIVSPRELHRGNNYACQRGAI